MLVGFSVDDDVVAIEKVSMNLVREDTLESVDSVTLADLGSVSSNLVVESSGLDDSDGRLERVPCSKNNISLLARNGVFTHDYGVSEKSREAIEVDTEIDLGNITLVEDGGIFSERAEMTADFVDRDANWESDTLVHFLSSESL